MKALRYSQVSQQTELPPPSLLLPPPGFKSPETICTQILHSGSASRGTQSKANGAMLISHKEGWEVVARVYPQNRSLSSSQRRREFSGGQEQQHR